MNLRFFSCALVCVSFVFCSYAYAMVPNADDFDLTYAAAHHDAQQESVRVGSETIDAAAPVGTSRN